MKDWWARVRWYFWNLVLTDVGMMVKYGTIVVALPWNNEKGRWINFASNEFYKTFDDALLRKNGIPRGW